MLRLLPHTQRAPWSRLAAHAIRRAHFSPPQKAPPSAQNSHLPYRQPYIHLPPPPAPSPLATDSERVIASPELQEKVLHRLRHSPLSDSASRSIYSLVQNAMQMASGPDGAAAYAFLLDAWAAAMHGQRTDSLFHTLLAQDAAKIVQIMLNKADYPAYAALVLPTSPARTWAHTVMETLQLTSRGGAVAHNAEEMAAFLRSSRPAAEKHKMNAIFVRKILLGAQSRHQTAGTVASFLDYYERVEGPFVGFSEAHYHVYKKSLALVAVPPPGVSMARHLAVLQDALEPSGATAYARFLSALMRSVAESHPHVSLQYWAHKVGDAENSAGDNDAGEAKAGGRRLGEKRALELRPEDLDSAMLAHISSRNYAAAMEVYSAHAALQRDSQIVLLLQVSEKTTDWKLLQAQFESMYGRGDLPHVAHYSLVMGALASIGATGETQRLYEQLLRRNLQPNSTVFRALVSGCLNAHDYDGAERHFNEFMAMVRAGKIAAGTVAAVQLERFRAQLLHSSVDTAMRELEALVQRQRASQEVLVDCATVAAMIRFLAATYAQETFAQVWQMACELDLVDEQVRCRAVAFWTRMGRFERASQLAFEAHLASAVPFQSAAVLAAELRNYREWYRQTASRTERSVLLDRINGIVARAEAGRVSPKNVSQLLAEIIKHHTVFGQLDAAKRVLERAKQLHVLHEAHFAPLLAEHSKEGSYDGSTEVLRLYGDMVAQNVAISAQTYQHLLRSLLQMNRANGRAAGNAYKLLESVFEAYGFAVVGTYKGRQVSLNDVAANAIHLLRIVSDYAIATAAHAEQNVDIVVDFLNQMRTVLGRRIDVRLRVAIFAEMSKVYRAYGNAPVAATLADNALGELHDILDRLPRRQPRPKPLQLEYRRIVAVKLQLLADGAAAPPEYVRVLDDCLRRNVRLSGGQFHAIFRKVAVAEGAVAADTLDKILDYTERFLVGGNWAEVAVSRKVHYIYRLYLLHLTVSMSPEAIEAQYAVLNRFYHTEDVRAVVAELGHLVNPYHALKTEVENFHTVCSGERWTVEDFFASVPEFFVPGRSLQTRNFLRPDLAARVASDVETLCAGDQTVAFGLYDKYPETMEYLLFFLGERARLTQFQNDICAAGVALHGEDREAKRRHYIAALEHLMPGKA